MFQQEMTSTDAHLDLDMVQSVISIVRCDTCVEGNGTTEAWMKTIIIISNILEPIKLEYSSSANHDLVWHSTPVSKTCKTGTSSPV